LHLQGNTLDWTFLNSLDEMGSESSDLVSEALGGDLGDFRKDIFIDVEIVS